MEYSEKRGVTVVEYFENRDENSVGQIVDMRVKEGRCVVVDKVVVV